MSGVELRIGFDPGRVATIGKLVLYGLFWLGILAMADSGFENPQATISDGGPTSITNGDRFIFSTGLAFTMALLIAIAEANWKSRHTSARN